MSNSLTVLLGAGSTMDTGNPGYPKGMFSTEQLTNELTKEQLPAFIDSGAMYVPKPDPGSPIEFPARSFPPYLFQIPIIPFIYRSLRAHYSYVDFELILHAVEQLLTYSNTVRFFKSTDPLRHVLASFVEIQTQHKLLNDPMILTRTHKQLIESIMSQINNRIYMLGNLERASQGLKSLLSPLKEPFKLKVFTLNYDDIIDFAFPEGVDGFTDGGGSLPHLSFNPALFLNASRSESHLLVHLHGSVRYGYANFPEKIGKYKSSQEAYDLIKRTSRSSANDTKNGEYFGDDPIISGLHKVSKLIHNPQPFGYYYQAFTDAILNSHRLLVIGYGARDEHINTWLQEFKKVHQDKRRVLWVSKVSGERIGEVSDYEMSLLRMLAGGNREFNESQIVLEPQNHFQEHGPNLRLIPTGFPFSDSSLSERILEFLGS